MEKISGISGLRVLAIGDSITSDGRWQREFERVTGAEVTTHARGGVGIIDMVFGLGCSESEGMKYDPYTGANRELPPLATSDLENTDLVIHRRGVIHVREPLVKLALTLYSPDRNGPVELADKSHCCP